MKDAGRLPAGLPLVGQDVHEGHGEDALPLWLSFDVADLWGETRASGWGPPAAVPGPARRVGAPGGLGREAGPHAQPLGEPES